MGIESEQLVFDYLSRIGDLAHGTSMTAAERARLVGRVRTDIERRRAEAGGAHTAAGVRKILDALGRPEEVVAGAGVSVPLPRGPEPVAEAGRPASPTAASPPHLAGIGELGPEESDPDWWRRGPGGRYAEGGRVRVGGFVGGIELPEVLKPPPDGGEDDGKGTGKTDGKVGDGEGTPADAGAAGTEKVPAAAPASASRRWAARLRRVRTAVKPAGGPRAGGIVELLAAALLVFGAVRGSLVPLGLGWLIAYWSPRLSRREAKGAVLAVPGAVAGAVLVWLWGRTEGRWGEPLAEGELGAAIGEAWPAALRAAAVASALYLVWRARRPKG